MERYEVPFTLRSMPGEGISIEVGSALPYLEDRLRALIGKDVATIELSSWFNTLQSTALALTSSVQCVGMRAPVPFEKIYQPTRILWHKLRRVISRSDPVSEANEEELYEISEVTSISSQDMALIRESAIIYAGPGYGKTTILHSLYRSALHDEHYLPMLITLRRPTAVCDLERLVSLGNLIRKKSKHNGMLLLVDGYDELSVPDRTRVSEALLRYQSLNVGRYILTCRSNYQVHNLNASHVTLEGFSLTNKVSFVGAFLSAYGSDLAPATVVEEFESRGLSEFLAHPLLLALACIVRTRPQAAQPRSAIRLLDRALEVLRFQWDESKGISRQRITPMDGYDHIQLLKRLAYMSLMPHIPRAAAEETTVGCLRSLGYEHVDPEKALLEIAQFYGILVPSDDGWEFAHRSIQDFLAAQYWVATGEFSKVQKFTWNSRTAYATCMLHDATSVLREALFSPDAIGVVHEVLSNEPRFDANSLLDPVFANLASFGRGSLTFRTNGRVAGTLDNRILRGANSLLLISIIKSCCEEERALSDVIIGSCLLQLAHRRETCDVVTYAKLLDRYQDEETRFIVRGEGAVSLRAVSPHLTREARFRDRGFSPSLSF